MNPLPASVSGHFRLVESQAAFRLLKHEEEKSSTVTVSPNRQSTDIFQTLPLVGQIVVLKACGCNLAFLRLAGERRYGGRTGFPVLLLLRFLDENSLPHVMWKTTFDTMGVQAQVLTAQHITAHAMHTMHSVRAHIYLEQCHVMSRRVGRHRFIALCSLDFQPSMTLHHKCIPESSPTRTPTHSHNRQSVPSATNTNNMTKRQPRIHSVPSVSNTVSIVVVAVATLVAGRYHVWLSRVVFFEFALEMAELMPEDCVFSLETNRHFLHLLLGFPDLVDLLLLKPGQWSR